MLKIDVEGLEHFPIAELGVIVSIIMDLQRCIGAFVKRVLPAAQDRHGAVVDLAGGIELIRRCQRVQRRVFAQGGLGDIALELESVRGASVPINLDTRLEDIPFIGAVITARDRSVVIIGVFPIDPIMGIAELAAVAECTNANIMKMCRIKPPFMRKIPHSQRLYCPWNEFNPLEWFIQWLTGDVKGKRHGNPWFDKFFSDSFRT